MSGFELTCVIPAWNEAPRIGWILKKHAQAVPLAGGRADLVVTPWGLACIPGALGLAALVRGEFPGDA